MPRLTSARPQRAKLFKQVERAILHLLQNPNPKAPKGAFQVFEQHPYETCAVLADFEDTLKALKNHIEPFMQENS